MSIVERVVVALGVWMPAAACLMAGCASPSMPDAPVEVAQEETHELREIPEELLLDVGISVFEPPRAMPDSDDESVFRNAEVLRAERNFLPYVIGKHLQGTETWGAVRVVPRPVAVDVTVTGTITHSDGETLAFRAKATDARGIQWFDKEYRATAEPGVYDGDTNVDDPFARAYAALAADVAASLRALSLDDLARIRAVAELAFARSVAPEAFARHVTRKPDGGHELRRLPANEDPLLAHVRQIRDRDQAFVDQVNDYYDDFTANIQRPYDEWRREAFLSRRAHRELSAKADAQMLLGSARMIDGLARMADGRPSRLVLDLTTRGLGLIRGAEDSEEQIRETVESMREIGRSAEANLLPHTTALENRTTRLQQGVESRYDALRAILNRLYREEFGLRTGSPESSAPGGDGRVPESPGMAGEQKANAQPLAVASSPRSASAVGTGIRRSRVDERMLDAKEEIRAGNVENALEQLDDLLADADEELGTVASARIHALMALGHIAQADDREAIAAFERVVGTACAVICSDEALANAGVVSRNSPPRPAAFKFVMEVQDQVNNGEIDAAIRSLGGSVDGGKSRSKPTLVGVPGVSRLLPVERAMAYQILARAYVEKKDYEAAIGVYESILELGPRAPRWDREFSNKNLALIHFSRKDYEKSLEYLRAWLGMSSWVGRACPKVC